MAAHGKTRILFELGEVELGNAWHDYRQYGFDAADVPALLAVAGDESLLYGDGHGDGDESAFWAPLHAWRALGQLQSPTAAAPLVALLDTLVEDDWALEELPMVVGMIGEAALAPLGEYLKEPHHDPFARVMAANGLAEIAKRHPQHRAQVLRHYQDYMATPDESAPVLNGLLVADLLDLDAREAIEDIRQLFARDCVELSCAGDVEDVEMALGFRTARDTPKPQYVPFPESGDDVELPRPDSDDPLEILEYYLLRYGHAGSILGVSELDGFFTALACAPGIIPPSVWAPAIWGGEDLSPEWEDAGEVDEFLNALFALYTVVMDSLLEDDFQPLFQEGEIDGEAMAFVVEWCEGFLRGLDLWGPLNAMDAAETQDCTQAVELFGTEAGLDSLANLSREQINDQQLQIEPGIRRLYRYFLDRRAQAGRPRVRETPKVGRNDPCPCGSGKKYKKCCLH